MCMNMDKQYDNAVENGSNMMNEQLTADGSIVFNFAYDEKGRLVSGKLEMVNVKVGSNTDLRHVKESGRSWVQTLSHLVPLAKFIVEKCGRPAKEHIERF